MLYLPNVNRYQQLLQFLFINDLKLTISENKARDLIFDVLILKLGQRLDTSHDFYAKFKFQNKKNKKAGGTLRGRINKQSKHNNING